jgi:hypothetical protein
MKLDWNKFNKNIVELTSFNEQNLTFCESCVKGKYFRIKFPK